VIIDGEIVALDDKGRPAFQLLKGYDMGLVRPPIVFYAFDLLRLQQQEELRSRGFGSEELARIKSHLGPDEYSDAP